MANVIISPVGTSVEPVKEFIREEGWSRLVLLPGMSADKLFKNKAKTGAKDPETIAEDIRREYSNAEVEIIPVDPFNFEKCLEKMMKVLIEEKSKAGDKKVIVNIAPGTNLMAASIAIAAIITGCDVKYLQEEYQGEEIVKSYITEPLSYDFEEMRELKPAHKKTLLTIEQLLAKKEKSDSKTIAESMSLGEKTVLGYLKILKKYDVIEEIEREGEKTWPREFKPTYKGRICRIMWESDSKLLEDKKKIE